MNQRHSMNTQRSQHKPYRSAAFISLLLLLTMLLAACTPAVTDQPGTTTDPANTSESTAGSASSDSSTNETDVTGATRLRIVSSFVPMYVFTANLIDGVPGIKLSNMAAPDTGCLHDYQLVPADMILLESSDLFIINGAGMEGFIGEIAASLPDLTQIEASHGITLLPAIGEHDHDHDDDHDEEADDPDDHEDELDGNPHVWLSVPLAIEQVKNISAGLQQADPEYATQYQMNEAAYIVTMEALYAEMQSALSGLEQRQMMTFHEAFPYFAEAFDLEIAGVILRDPGSEPSAAELAETIDKVRDLELRALFAEPQYPERVAETIAAETGAQVFFLDPITTGTPTATLYEEKMRQNMQVLLDALG